MGTFSLTSYTFPVLSILILLPILGAAILTLTDSKTARTFAVIAALTEFLLSLVLAVNFNPAQSGMQFAELHRWIPSLGITYIIGIDGLSLGLVVLTTLLIFLALAASTGITKRIRAFCALMLLLESGVIGAFVSLDLVLFYLFWELMLVPMYFLIGVWGGERRIYAALKFVLFTAFGSLLMLVAIVYLGTKHGVDFSSSSFFLGDLQHLQLSRTEELYLFAAFALAFAIKVPVFPLHTWLPDAHTEAPTGGSVILAGVLLKLGLYGLIRFCIPLFPRAVIETQFLFALLGVVGIVYGALMAWVQTDMKRLVAYSSVSHLGFCVLGYASLNFEGLQGCVLQMFNHGISTGALFLLVGVLYDRKHTREIRDYSGLAVQIPIFCAVYLAFTLSSIALPLTNGFIGEFLVLYGGFKYNVALAAVAVSGVILGAVYMLSLYRRICFGPTMQERDSHALPDLTMREGLVFATMLLFVAFIGLHPMPFLTRQESASRSTLATISSHAAATYSQLEGELPR